MLHLLIVIFLIPGNLRSTLVYPPVKRDARISGKDMQKSLVFVRKDAAQCRRELREFKMKLAKLNTGINKKKSAMKSAGKKSNTATIEETNTSN